MLDILDRGGQRSLGRLLLWSVLGAAAVAFGSRRRGALASALAAGGRGLLERGLRRAPGRPAARRAPRDAEIGLRRGALDAVAAARLKV